MNILCRFAEPTKHFSPRWLCRSDLTDSFAPRQEGIANSQTLDLDSHLRGSRYWDSARIYRTPGVSPSLLSLYCRRRRVSQAQYRTMILCTVPDQQKRFFLVRNSLCDWLCLHRKYYLRVERSSRWHCALEESHHSGDAHCLHWINSLYHHHSQAYLTIYRRILHRNDFSSGI